MSKNRETSTCPHELPLYAGELVLLLLLLLLNALLLFARGEICYGAA